MKSKIVLSALGFFAMVAVGRAAAGEESPSADEAGSGQATSEQQPADQPVEPLYGMSAVLAIGVGVAPELAALGGNLTLQADYLYESGLTLGAFGTASFATLAHEDEDAGREEDEELALFGYHLGASVGYMGTGSFAPLAQLGLGYGEYLLRPRGVGEPLLGHGFVGSLRLGAAKDRASALSLRVDVPLFLPTDESAALSGPRGVLVGVELGIRFGG